MIREEFNGDELKFPFVMYRPAETKEALPMMVFLHGAGESGYGGKDLYKVDIHGVSRVLADGKEYPCIFVLPQCSPESFWVAEISDLYYFIQAIKERYKVDEKRVYLTGYSMGAYGNWFMAQRYPQLFAAIAPVAGGGMVWKAHALDMAIWAFHGTEDEVVGVSETMNMIRKIRTVGLNNTETKMTLLDNVGHNASDYAYTAELIDWLLTKSR